MNQAEHGYKPELEELSVSELVVEALDRVSGAKWDLRHYVDRSKIYDGLFEATKALKELQTRTG